MDSRGDLFRSMSPKCVPPSKPFFISCDVLFHTPRSTDVSPDIPTSHDSDPFFPLPLSSTSSLHPLDNSYVPPIRFSSDSPALPSNPPTMSDTLGYIPHGTTFVPVTQVEFVPHIVPSSSDLISTVSLPTSRYFSQDPSMLFCFHSQHLLLLFRAHILWLLGLGRLFKPLHLLIPLTLVCKLDSQL